ncbi:MAG: YbjP/YqhG family protein [Muribaculaceae bacterium]|nr:YbjP/YqhG family protein [Muribaculaceae bacterium]
MSALFSYGQCEEQIKDFYVAYMQNSEKDESANVELMKKHMSAELIAKLAGYTAQYDADAVIHAQDVSGYAIQSLSVYPLKNDDEYLVRYKWAPESDYTFITVRAILSDGKLKFLDIYPQKAELDLKSFIK